MDATGEKVIEALDYLKSKAQELKRLLEIADEDHNKLRKTKGLPELDNIGRWKAKLEKEKKEKC